MKQENKNDDLRVVGVDLGSSDGDITVKINYIMTEEGIVTTISDEEILKIISMEGIKYDE